MRYKIEIETWAPENGKGIDDLLCAGGQSQTLVGKKAESFLQTLVQAGGGEAKEQFGSPVQADAEEGEAIESSPRHDEPAELKDADGSISASPVKGPPRFPYGDGPPAPFPLDNFPPLLQSVTSEISQAVHCPLDFPACAMLCVAGVAIGRSRQVEPLEDWKVSARIYMGLVGEPGSGKTPAVNKVMRPLWRQEARWRDEYAGAKKEHEIDMLAYEVNKKEYLSRVRKVTQQPRTSLPKQESQEADGEGTERSNV